MRDKFLARGNHEGLKWRSNSRLSLMEYESVTLHTVPRGFPQ